MTKMFWTDIDNENIVSDIRCPFPSEKSFDDALEWCNTTSKKQQIRYCSERQVDLSDDIETLLDGWNSIAAAVYAWQKEDINMITFIRMLANDIRNEASA